MPVFRIKKRNDFTIISNTIFKDKTLSARAKGLLAEMLSLPEDWDYTLKGLSSLFSDGIDSIRSGIRELEEHGYVVRQRSRTEDGRLAGIEYIIYETPHIVGAFTPVQDAPVTESPISEKPSQEKPMQAEPMTYKELNTLRTDSSSTYESNPYQSIAGHDRMGYDEAREAVRENIEYGILCDKYPHEMVDEIVDIAAEALCSPKEHFELGKDTFPFSLVKDRILRLDSSCVEYIFSCIRSNAADIRNIKQYLLKTIVNAPATIEHYYETKVNHDLRNYQPRSEAEAATGYTSGFRYP